MHMADALVSPPVAAAAGAVAIALIGISSRKVKSIRRNDIVPLMGVMGAFIFAAQMINFSIPGTGSSGHIIGGILLAAVMGPWAAFIALVSVLIIQCLIFADGGLMALGCNIVNMAAMTCLIAYPLVFHPIAGRTPNKYRLFIASVAACIIGLELGAVAVTLETELSGITALPTLKFLTFMSTIHLAIGLCEGLATAFVLLFVSYYKPDILYSYGNNKDFSNLHAGISRKTKVLLWSLLGAAIIMAAGFTWIASSSPDGLEWSIEKITGHTELGDAIIPSSAIIPDYDSTFAGLIGGLIVMVMLWCVASFLFRRKTKQNV